MFNIHVLYLCLLCFSKLINVRKRLDDTSFKLTQAFKETLVAVTKKKTKVQPCTKCNIWRKKQQRNQMYRFCDYLVNKVTNKKQTVTYTTDCRRFSSAMVQLDSRVYQWKNWPSFN